MNIFLENHLKKKAIPTKEPQEFKKLQSFEEQ